MRICAVIPTYNNIGTVKDIVERVLRYLPTIVVADGPTDGSLEAVQSIQDNRLEIVAYPKNQGKGYALKQGFKKAHEEGYTHVLTIDSDGQHYPEDIPSLIRMAQIRQDAIIIGSRPSAPKNKPAQSTFANRFSNFWFAVQTGLALPDTQTGFRIYPLAHTSGMWCMTKRYEAELLLLVFSAWACTPIVSVPIRVYYPPKEERVSYFRPVRDFGRISLLNTLLCLLAVIYGLPRRYWRMLYFGTLFLVFALWCNCCLVWYKLFMPSRIMTQLRHQLGVGSNCLLRLFPGARLTIQYEDGVSPLEQSLPSIWIANHGSLLDALIMLSLSDKLVLVGRQHVATNFFYGKIARAMGIITVEEGVDNLLSAIESHISKGLSVAIFPEGTRTYNGEICRFHRGAFYVAEQLNIPIKPILLKDFYTALSKKPFYVGAPSEMKVRIKPDILPTDTSFGTDYRSRTKAIRRMYLDWICES